MLSRMRLKSRKKAMEQLAKSYPQVRIEDHATAVEKWWARRKMEKPAALKQGRRPGRPKKVQAAAADTSIQTIEAACNLEQILTGSQLKASDAIRIVQLVQLVGGETRVEPVVDAIRKLRGLIVK